MTISQLGGTTPQSYLQSPAFQTLPQVEKDQLTQSLSSDQLNVLFPPDLQALPIPQDQSLQEFFRTVVATLRIFADQLQASELIDVEAGKRISAAAAAAAAVLADEYKQLSAAILAAQQEAQSNVDTLNSILPNLQSQVDNQTAQVNNLNGGNSTEQSNATALQSAYGTFVAAIKKAGAIDEGGGYFVFTGGSTQVVSAFLTAYNTARNTFLTAISNFNTYLTGRNSAIDAYNTATGTYNTTVNSNDNVFNNIFSTYGVYLLQYAQPGASTRASSTEMTASGTPEDISNRSFPYVFFTAPPNNSITNIIGNGAPTVTMQPPYPPYSNGISGPNPGGVYYTPIYNSIFNAKIAPIYNQINALLSQFIFQNALALLFPSPFSDVPDPALNQKPILKKIYPATNIDPTKPLEVGGIQGGGALASVTVLGNSHAEALLGLTNFGQSLNLTSLKLTSEQLQQATLALTLLSIGLLNNSVSKAILPSLGPLGNVIGTLPQNSPIFAALFAVSLVNRLLETTQNGTTTAAVQALIQQLPALAGLSVNDQKALAALLNLGLLQLSAKLLGATLGFPQLPALLLLTSISPEKAVALFQNAILEQKQNLIGLEKQLVQQLLGKGFGLAEAKFLAHFAAKSVGLALAPSVQLVGEKTVSKEILTSSIVASLITEGKSLGEAQKIATRVVEKTLEQKPVPEIVFKEKLEQVLRSEGIKTNVPEIVNQAILVPNFVNLASITSKEPFTPTLTPTEPFTPPFTPTEPFTPTFTEPFTPPFTPTEPFTPPFTPTFTPTFTEPFTPTFTPTFTEPFTPTETFTSTVTTPTETVTSTVTTPTEQVTPTVTPTESFSSQDAVSAQVAQDSLTSSLIEQGRSSADAKEISARAVKTALAQGPVSEDTFKTNLAAALVSEGISRQTLADAINKAVLLAAKAIHPEAEKEAAKTANLAKDKVDDLKALLKMKAEGASELDTAQLLALIKKLIQSLLAPQLAPLLASQVTDAVAAALFGTPNPDAFDKADVKKPFSLVNAVKSQIDVLKKNQNELFTEFVTVLFKDTIKESVQLDAFFEKLMDPGTTLVGIMYAGREPSNWKKSIDIQV